MSSLKRQHIERASSIHAAVPEVAPVRDAELGGHLEDGVVDRVLPVEVLGNIVRGDGKREDTALGVAGKHDFGERTVEHVHLWLEVRVGLRHRLSANDGCLAGRGAMRVQIQGDVAEGGLEA